VREISLDSILGLCGWFLWGLKEKKIIIFLFFWESIFRNGFSFSKSLVSNQKDNYLFFLNPSKEEGAVAPKTLATAREIYIFLI
jgi:hypothetical protein